MRLIALLLCSLCLQAQVWTCADNWAPQAQPTSSYMGGMTFDGNRYWVVGDHGMIMSSLDGLQWDRKFTPCFGQLSAIAWNGIRYVAVGAKGLVVTSLDGDHWSVWSSGTNLRLRGVIAAESFFYVFGDDGLLMVSWFGGWLPLNSNTANDLYAAGKFDDRLVMVGSGGTIIYSDNNVDWIVPSVSTGNRLHDVVANGSVLIAVGTQGTIVRSTNLGSSWTVIAQGGINPCSYRVATTLDGDFHIMGNNGCHKTSSDGLSWGAGSAGVTGFSASSETSDGFESIASSVDGRFLSYQQGGLWQEYSSGTRKWLIAIHQDNGVAVAVGFDGEILRSQSSGNWQSATSNTNEHLFDVNRLGGTWIAVGYQSTLLTSPDGTLWSPVAIPGALQFSALATGNGRAIAVARSGEIYYSDDAVLWLPANTSAIVDTMQASIFLPSSQYFVAAGGDGGLYYSDDGTDWDISFDSGDLTMEWIQSLTLHNGNIVGLTSLGTLITSVNGEDWSLLGSVPSWQYLHSRAIGSHNGVLYLLGQYIQPSVITKSGPTPIPDSTTLVFSSLNGSNWKPQPAMIHFDLAYDMEWWGNELITVGLQGSIHRFVSLSDEFSNWAITQQVGDYVAMINRCWQ